MALVLGSLGCDTEAKKQRQALEAEKARLIAEQTEKERQEFFVQSGRWPSPNAVKDLAEINLPMLITALIQQGGDVNPEDKYCRTPLHIAEANNAHETVALLKRYGGRR